MTATPNTPGGFFCTRCEYNAKGQLTKQYQDTGSNTAANRPDALRIRQLRQCGETDSCAGRYPPTKFNCPVVEIAYSVESTETGVFSITTNTRYNAEGNPLVSVQKLLASHLSNAVKRKNLTIDERT